MRIYELARAVLMAEIDRNVHGLVPSLVRLYYRLQDFLSSDAESHDYDQDVAAALHEGRIETPTRPSGGS